MQVLYDEGVANHRPQAGAGVGEDVAKRRQGNGRPAIEPRQKATGADAVC